MSIATIFPVEITRSSGTGLRRRGRLGTGRGQGSPYGRRIGPVGRCDGAGEHVSATTKGILCDGHGRGRGRSHGGHGRGRCQRRILLRDGAGKRPLDYGGGRWRCEGPRHRSGSRNRRRLLEARKGVQPVPGIAALRPFRQMSFRELAQGPEDRAVERGWAALTAAGAAGLPMGGYSGWGRCGRLAFPSPLYIWVKEFGSGGGACTGTAAGAGARGVIAATSSAV